MLQKGPEAYILYTLFTHGKPVYEHNMAGVAHSDVATAVILRAAVIDHLKRVVLQDTAAGSAARRDETTVHLTDLPDNGIVAGASECCN